jgi:hypothetical protein
MAPLTEAQRGWLQTQALAAASRTDLRAYDYDVLAWADAAVGAWEHAMYACARLPTWYRRNYDRAVQLMLDTLWLDGAAQAELAALARIRHERTLRHYRTLLLTAPRELLWLEHLRWLNTADPYQIADSVDLYRPTYESIFVAMES